MPSLFISDVLYLYDVDLIKQLEQIYSWFISKSDFTFNDELILHFNLFRQLQVKLCSERILMILIVLNWPVSTRIWLKQIEVNIYFRFVISRCWWASIWNTTLKWIIVRNRCSKSNKKINSFFVILKRTKKRRSS